MNSFPSLITTIRVHISWARCLYFLIIIAMLASSGIAVPTYLISCYAGVGSTSNTGDGGPATSAYLSALYGMWQDTTGVTYLAVFDGNRIRKVDASGIITTVTGNGSPTSTGDNGPATQATLYYPTSVWGTTMGTLYISDSSGHKLRSIALSTNIMTTYAGIGSVGADGNNGPASSASLNSVYGVVGNTIGALYLMDISYQNIRQISPSGIITVICGTSSTTTTFNGDNIPATSANIKNPLSAILDSNQNLIFSEIYRVRKFSISGTITTITGTGTAAFGGDTGPATQAQVYSPWGLVLDTQGAMYIATEGDHRIRWISSASIIYTIAGTGTAGLDGNGGQATAATLFVPTGIWKTSTGLVYFCQNAMVRLLVDNSPTSAPSALPTIVPTGKPSVVPTLVPTAKNAISYAISTVAGKGLVGTYINNVAATATPVNGQYDIWQDTMGNLYTADYVDGVVRRIDSSGIILTRVGIVGTSASTGDKGPGTSATLNNPSAVWGSTVDTMYIAERSGCRIRSVALSTNIVSLYGGASCGYSGNDGQASNAAFGNLFGIRGDSVGNFYITDFTYCTVRKISSSGIITAFSGGGTSYSENIRATSAAMNGPIGVFVDTNNLVYVSIYNESKVRKISNGVISTYAGTTSSGYSGDGGPATAATCTIPWGVWMDSTGSLFFASVTDARYRMVSASGIITTVAGNGGVGFSGDGGSSLDASIQNAYGVWGNTNGIVYLSMYYAVRKLTNNNPTLNPTAAPSTAAPSVLPTIVPSLSPTIVPTRSPSALPSVCPSLLPTALPSALPTAMPSVSFQPSLLPSVSPTTIPSMVPTINPTFSPSSQPSMTPSCIPTLIPSNCPVNPTFTPSIGPTFAPSTVPTIQPSCNPSISPSVSPSNLPSCIPSLVPTNVPSISPSVNPSASPSRTPSGNPTCTPSNFPSIFPSVSPSTLPSVAPAGSVQPTVSPSVVPTVMPSMCPSTVLPTLVPTCLPSVTPTGTPSVCPSVLPTIIPTMIPSVSPSISPSFSFAPSADPSMGPTATPSVIPSFEPTSSAPAFGPTVIPSAMPVTKAPSRIPTTSAPTNVNPISYLIFTLTGNGVMASGGDNGPASAASLAYPQGIWTDSTGVMFIADSNGYKIRRIDTVGIITTFAGSGIVGSTGDGLSASSITLRYPASVWANTLGVTYFADYSARNIRCVAASTLIVSTIAGTGGQFDAGDGGRATAAAFTYLQGIYGDSVGNIYTSDYGAHKIRRITSAGIINVYCGTGLGSYNGENIPMTAANIYTPYNVLIVADGRMFITENSNARVRVVSTAGLVSTFAGGSSTYKGDGSSATSGGFAQPFGVFMDTSLALFITTYADYRVRMVSSSSIIYTVAGNGSPSYSGDGGPALDASINGPTGVTGDTLGHVYFTAYAVARQLVNNNPTIAPSVMPTISLAPTVMPSIAPTAPTIVPSVAPSQPPSCLPTLLPSVTPSIAPSLLPTYIPSFDPTVPPTVSPSVEPTLTPSTSPSVDPSIFPSVNPSLVPSIVPSVLPTLLPTLGPSFHPSQIPTLTPSVEPSLTPTTLPSVAPSTVPSYSPSYQPSVIPSLLPSATPSILPSISPSFNPTIGPSLIPSLIPSANPSFAPSLGPSFIPSFIPSLADTIAPSTCPTLVPSIDYTVCPSTLPSTFPSLFPSLVPTILPTFVPSVSPTLDPTIAPITCTPSMAPSLSSEPPLSPSLQPSAVPSILFNEPSQNPTQCPTAIPSFDPSSQVPTISSNRPTGLPSMSPTAVPSTVSTCDPSTEPSRQPSVNPSLKPSTAPTLTSSLAPSVSPSCSPSIFPSLAHPSAAPSTVEYYATHPKSTLPYNHSISVNGWSVDSKFQIIIPFLSLASGTYGSAYSNITLTSGSVGTVYLVSGMKSYPFMLSLPSDASGAYTSFIGADTAKRSVSVLSDINGDGLADLIIGDPFVARCYVLFGSIHGLVGLSTGFTIFGEHDSDLTGWSVSDAGDVNNDTLHDIAIGAPFVNGVGAIYVIYGRRSSHVDVYLNKLNSSTGFVVYSTQKSDYLGISISTAGDVNNDGYDDIIAGAVMTSAFTAGAAVVIYGSPSGIEALSLSQLSVSQGFLVAGFSYSYTGYSVSCAGDVNDDGFDDVLIGSSPQRSSLIPTAYLVYGSSSGSNLALASLASSQGVRITGGGVLVSSAGDMDGDGFADLLIGSEIGSSLVSTGLIVYSNVTLLPMITTAPSLLPSVSPLTSRKPTMRPSPSATNCPSLKPSTKPSVFPTLIPTAPTAAPTVGASQPSISPTALPSAPSVTPSEMPSLPPTTEPSECPSTHPTVEPSEPPTQIPSRLPTLRPSQCPTLMPSPSPMTRIPSMASRSPFSAPSLQPTVTVTSEVTGFVATYYLTKDGSSVNNTVSHTHFVINSTGHTSIGSSGGSFNVYSITPKQNATVTIHFFNKSSDVIDLTLFVGINGLSQLKITEGSIKIELPNRQLIYVLNLHPGDVTENNFLFWKSPNTEQTVSQTVKTLSVVAGVLISVVGVVFVTCLACRVYESRLAHIKAAEKSVKSRHLYTISDGDHERFWNDSESHSGSVVLSDHTIDSNGEWQIKLDANDDTAENLSAHTLDSHGEWIVKLDRVSEDGSSRVLSDFSVNSEGDFVERV